MWENPAMVPPYKPQERVPRDIYDVVLNSQPIWVMNPQDTEEVFYENRSIYVCVYDIDGQGAKKTEITEPFSSTPRLLNGGQERSMEPAVRFAAVGEYILRTFRMPPGSTTWEQRTEQRIRVRPAPVGSIWSPAAPNSMGTILESGAGSRTGGQVFNNVLMIGDDGTNGTLGTRVINGQLKGFVTFDLGGLGDFQVVENVVIGLTVTGIQLISPFGQSPAGGAGGWGGRLVMDLTSGSFGETDDLEPNDFQGPERSGPATVLNAAQFSKAGQVGTKIFASVKREALHLFQGRAKVQARIYFEDPSNLSRGADFLTFGTSGVDGPAIYLGYNFTNRPVVSAAIGIKNGQSLSFGREIIGASAGNEWTVEMWVPIGLGGGLSLRGFTPDANSDAVSIRIPANGERIRWAYGGGQRVLDFSPGQHVLSNWNHFAFVVSSNRNVMEIFLNGQRVAQSSGVDLLPPGPMTLRLGTDSDVGSTGLNELRIWNRARTAEEIAATFRTPIRVAMPGLLANFAGTTSAREIRQLHDFSGSNTPFLSVEPVGTIPFFGEAEPVFGARTDADPVKAAVGEVLLRGVVEPGGRASRYYFEYGSNGKLTSKTKTKNREATLQTFPVTETVRGLREGSTYQYRLVAEYEQGPGVWQRIAGEIATFTTGSSGRALAMTGQNTFSPGKQLEDTLLNSQNFTLEFWAQGGVRTEQTLFRFGSGQGHQLLFQAPSWDGLALFQVGNLTAGFYLDPSLASRWTHWALARRMHDGKPVLEIYTNGVLAASSTRPLIRAEQPPLDTHMDGDHGGDGFQGELDEVRLWTRAVSEEEGLASTDFTPLQGQVVAGSGRTPSGAPVRDPRAVLNLGRAASLRLGSWINISPLTFLTNRLDGLTLEFWINPEKDADQTFVEFRGGAGASRLRVGSSADGRSLVLRSGAGDGSNEHQFLNGESFAGKWSHVAVVFVGEGGKGTTRAYLNGHFISEHKALEILWDELSNVVIGSAQFSGEIEEFRLWTRVRSQEEILGSLFGRLYGDEPDLALYFPFDENEGETVENRTSEAVLVAEQGTVARAESSAIRSEWSRKVMLRSNGNSAHPFEISFLSPGGLFEVQRSDNLLDWTPVGIAQEAEPARFHWQPANPAGERGFFRVRTIR
jgi:hypothetical protein